MMKCMQMKGFQLEMSKKTYDADSKNNNKLNYIQMITAKRKWQA